VARRRPRLAERAAENLWIFERLPDGWKAETLRMMAGSGRDELAAQRRPLLLDALETSLYAWKGDEPEPKPMSDHDEERLVKTSTELVQRFSRLPDGWRVEVLRRIADGATPLDAIADAQQAINVVRAYGIRIAWCAEPEPPRAGDAD
jgi:hypothetical protein